MFRLPFLFIITGLISFTLFQLFSLFDFATWLTVFGDEPRYPTGWFRVHLLVLGWATMIAMGAMYQLIPVVLQNHSLFSEKLGFVHYGFFAVGTAGLLFGFQSMQVMWIAGFATVAFIGVLLFAINIGVTLIRARKWSLSLAHSLTLIGIIIVIISPFTPDIMAQSRMAVVLGWLYLWGWVGLTLLSYLSKIVPFLWWTHKYGPLIGKKKIPTMSDLIDDRRVHIGLSVIGTSLFMLMVGLSWNQPWMTSIGGSLLSLSSLFYISLIANVFTK